MKNFTRFGSLLIGLGNSRTGQASRFHLFQNHRLLCRDAPSEIPLIAWVFALVGIIGQSIEN